jgi:hypothetical protein
MKQTGIIRPDNRARESDQHQPSAALDRLSEFLNSNLELLDLHHGRQSGLEQWIV